MQRQQQGLLGCSLLGNMEHAAAEPGKRMAATNLKTSHMHTEPGTCRQRSVLPEQHDVRLWPVDGIVLPAARLLDSKASPFILQKEYDELRAASITATALLHALQNSTTPTAYL